MWCAVLPWALSLRGALPVDAVIPTVPVCIPAPYRITPTMQARSDLSQIVLSERPLVVADQVRLIQKPLP
jgi:hypothetical protein